MTDSTPVEVVTTIPSAATASVSSASNTAMDLSYIKTSSSAHGKGTFASQDIKAGSVIFTEARPLIMVLDKPHRYDFCSWCLTPNDDESMLMAGETAKEVKKCAGCFCVAFCSKECQTLAWNHDHKYWCKPLANSSAKGERQMPNTALMILIVCLLLKARQFKKISTQADDVLKEFLELYGADNVDAVKREAEKVDKLTTMEAICFGTLQFANWGHDAQGWQAIHEVLARVGFNALSLLRPSFESCGSAIYKKISRVNHSCDPNIFATFNGPKLTVRALKDIKKDEELLWTYIDGNMPYYKRKEQLQRVYCFECKCSRCRLKLQDRADTDWTPGATLPDVVYMNMRGMDPDVIDKNERPHTEDYLPPGANQELLSQEELYKAELSAIMDHYLKLANRLPEAELDDEGDPQSENFEATNLHLLILGLDFAARTRVFTPTRHPYNELRHAFVIACLSTPYLATAFRYQLAAYFFIDPVLYEQTWHPLRVISKWKLANIALNVAEIDIPQETSVFNSSISLRDTIEAESLKRLHSHAHELEWGVIIYGLLLESADNAMVSHGPESTFTKMIRAKLAEVEGDMINARGVEEIPKVKRRIGAQWKVLRKIAEGVHDEALRTAAGSMEPLPGADTTLGPWNFPETTRFGTRRTRDWR